MLCERNNLRIVFCRFVVDVFNTFNLGEHYKNTILIGNVTHNIFKKERKKERKKKTHKNTNVLKNGEVFFKRVTMCYKHIVNLMKFEIKMHTNGKNILKEQRLCSVLNLTN